MESVSLEEEKKRVQNYTALKDIRNLCRQEKETKTNR